MQALIGAGLGLGLNGLGSAGSGLEAQPSTSLAPSKTPNATVEQSAPTKVPVLTAGDITPATMRQYENACNNYFVHKKIPGDDQVSMIVGGLLDTRVADWIDADRVRIVDLSFADFMDEFRHAYLEEDWEEDTRRDVLGMSQGSDSFWDYAVSLQSKNSLLHGTTSHLSDEQLRHQLGAGMELRLSKKIGGEKVNKIVDFRRWLNEVKRFDDQIHDEREEYERILKESREAGRRANASGEPNRRMPSNNNTSSSSTMAHMPRKQCPALLASERQLLNENDGCLKCQRVFVSHRAATCPNNFPSPINYKTLTQSDVDRFKRSRNKLIAAVSTSTAPQPPTPADTSSNTLDQPNVSQYHPVAAVMGMSSNPVAYAASNTSNVIGSDSNDSGSDSDSLPGVSAPFSAVCAMMTPVRDTASPLHVPHLYWCCLTSGKNQEFPITFNALIDHGSSSVLIRESLANELGLRRRRLRDPFSAELAMENDGQKIEIQFSDYVKLQLHDPSALWSLKTTSGPTESSWSPN